MRSQAKFIPMVTPGTRWLLTVPIVVNSINRGNTIVSATIETTNDQIALSASDPIDLTPAPSKPEVHVGEAWECWVHGKFDRQTLFVISDGDNWVNVHGGKVPANLVTPIRMLSSVSDVKVKPETDEGPLPAKQAGNLRRGQRIKLSGVGATVTRVDHNGVHVHVDGAGSLGDRVNEVNLELHPEWEVEAEPEPHYETGQVYRPKGSSSLYIRSPDGWRKIRGDGTVQLTERTDLGPMEKVS